jgi:hypothetical protein
MNAQPQLEAYADICRRIDDDEHRHASFDKAIMSVHPAFAALDQADADKVMKVCLPQFVDILGRCGRISEGKISALINQNMCAVYLVFISSSLFINAFNSGIQRRASGSEASHSYHRTARRRCRKGL